MTTIESIAITDVVKNIGGMTIMEDLMIAKVTTFMATEHMSILHEGRHPTSPTILTAIRRLVCMINMEITDDMAAMEALITIKALNIVAADHTTMHLHTTITQETCQKPIQG